MTDSTRIEPPLAQQLTRIDEPMERKRVGDMLVTKFSGLTFQEYREAIEFAKMMAQGRHSVPAYLQQNPGDCLAIVTQALRWKLEPFWVAQHSYIAKRESIIAYDAAVHAAILLSSDLLKSRPRYTYEGEGDALTCTVSVMLKGETEPLTLTTPPLAKCRPRRNEEGVVKGSPLWDRNPNQQLGYFAIRDWGRRHVPELLGGVYDRDEFEDTTQEETPILPPSPNLMNRLPGKMEGAGFAAPPAAHVIDADIAKEAEAKEAEVKAAKAARQEAPREPDASEGHPDTPKPEKRASEAPPKPAGPPRTPTTIEEYETHLDTWVRLGSIVAELEQQWRNEAALRQACKIPLTQRKKMEGVVSARVKELRETPPAKKR